MKKKKNTASPAANAPLGVLFYLRCDEVNTLHWAVALAQLIERLNEITTQVGKKCSTLIQSQLQHWISGLPSDLKAYLPISGCAADLRLRCRSQAAKVELIKAA
ncbi:hypothetical protein ACE6ED_26730 [Paenibacillus sp. CN-4]|uniref:hypothetical protein n=1 Tax=Paenibacillus nanchangensis TaxID=3348343 RepID=UPI003978B4B1